MSKQDVLVINYTGRKGGGPLCAIGMTKALCEKGIPVVAIISKYIDNRDEWDKLPLVEIIEITTYNNKYEFIMSTCKFLAFGKRNIRERLKKYNVKAVFCPMPTFWTRPINKLFPNALTVSALHDPIPHSGENFFTRNTSPWLDAIYRQSDVVVVHSRIFIQHVREKYGEKVAYFPLGELNKGYSDCDTKKSAVEYSEEKINYLFFGTISKYKGLEYLAKAYESVKKAIPNATLTIAGNGDFSPYIDLYDKLEDVNIINRWIEDSEVESFFDGPNVIAVLPYTDATQSGVILVTFGYGVPVIATRTGGLEEQVFDGETGYLVAPSNSEALADAMIKIGSSKELYQNMREAAFSKKDYFSWFTSADKLLELVKSYTQYEWLVK